ncbi:MAG: MunI regulatory protein [Ilumatobacteraceae bacterium]|nr:MunI regulatory protein [Ilumatobacteraceae bacterium]
MTSRAVFPHVPYPSSPKQTVQKGFGSNLRRLRLERRLTQAQLAKRAGVHWTYVGQIERGERNLSLLNIVRLGRGLHVPTADLFDGIEELPLLAD